MGKGVCRSGAGNNTLCLQEIEGREGLEELNGAREVSDDLRRGCVRIFEAFREEGGDASPVLVPFMLKRRNSKC